MKGVIKRKNTYYLKKQIGGEIRYLTLRTGDKLVAEARAKALIADITAGIYSGPKKSAGKKVVDLIKQYEKVGQIRGLKQATIDRNTSCFKRILRDCKLGEDAPLEKITGEVVSRWANMRMGKGSSTRQRTSAASTLRQAKGVLARWALPEYEREWGKLPEGLASFAARTPVFRTPQRTYELPPAELIDITLSAGRASRTEDPQRYLVFLCAYDLGMRASEIAHSSIDWITCEQGTRVMQIRPRPGFTPKHGRARSIPVSDQVWAHIQEAVKKTGSAFIIAQPSYYTRYNYIAREFSGWMRSLGWDRSRWAHAAHELRALQGSRWYTELGAQVAQEWLGHRDISTTCKHYARLRGGGFAPLPMDYTPAVVPFEAVS